MNRRQFLQNTGASASAVSATALSITSAAAVLSGEQFAKAASSERVRVGVVGGGGRALSLNRTFSANPNVEVVGIADLDPGRLAKAVEEVTKRQGKKPAAMKDFRQLVDDDSIDALVVGTPDHWHAIPTIMACQAGKDVYVEKPDGHNIVEGQTMVAALKKHKRVVQMGSQHRSTERMKSAFEFIRTGALGKCLVAKAWESTRQGSIGNPPDGEPPAGIDYDFWLGPAPKRPFNPRRFHGNWRWFYDYGTGDLGNDGVHRLDMAIAALNVACETQGDPKVTMPTRIMAAGGKWYFDDAQQFPDTLQVTYEYGSDGDSPKILTYEMRIWAPYIMETHTEGALVYGDRAYIVIGNSGWKAYGNGNRLIKEQSGDSFEGPHVQNFVDCIKSREKPNCDLETVGHPASVLCHSGNIAARVGRQLNFDPKTETFLDDDEANALRTRAEYRKPWALPEV
jgi:predicted dehydrogenase